jgi:hypothetical protein
MERNNGTQFICSQRASFISKGRYGHYSMNATSIACFWIILKLILPATG